MSSFYRTAALAMYWLLVACGDDSSDTASTSAPNAGSAGVNAGGGAGQAGSGGGGNGGSAAGSGGSGGSNAGSGGSSVAGSGAGGGGSDAGSGGSGTDPSACVYEESAGTPPTKEEIQFQALNDLPSGSWLLINDWDAQPNKVIAVSPDGTQRIELFQASRVWSLGATPDGKQIAFACNDPAQEAHYGITLGDAIQQTWIYDVATKDASLPRAGNVNDECLTFGTDGSLFLCRRYDFTKDNQNKGYRVGRLDLSSSEFTFLTPLLDKTYDLKPSPLPDLSAFLFHRIKIVGSKSSSSIFRQPMTACAEPQELHTEASRPVVAADGLRYLFQAAVPGERWLHEAKFNDSEPTVVVTKDTSTFAYSPDGKEAAFLVQDQANNCAHVEIARVDGSEADTPRRVVDCTKTPGFFTQLAWVNRP